MVKMPRRAVETCSQVFATQELAAYNRRVPSAIGHEDDRIYGSPSSKLQFVMADILGQVWPQQTSLVEQQARDGVRDLIHDVNKIEGEV